jgi:hypothetical protein
LLLARSSESAGERGPDFDSKSVSDALASQHDASAAQPKWARTSQSLSSGALSGEVRRKIDPTGHPGEVQAHSQESETTIAELLGRSFHHYAILGPFATIGGETLYAAWDRVLERKVALWVTARRVRSSVRVKSTLGAIMPPRTFVGARALARVTDPAIVGILGSGEDAELSFLSFEAFVGKTWNQFLATNHIEPRDALDMLRPIARALAIVHERGLVCGRLDGEQIWVDAHGSPRLWVLQAEKVKSTTPGAWGAAPFQEWPTGKSSPPQPPAASSVDRQQSDDVRAFAILVLTALCRCKVEHLRLTDLRSGMLRDWRGRVIAPELANLLARALSSDPTLAIENGEILAKELQAFDWPISRRKLLIPTALGTALIACAFAVPVHETATDRCTELDPLGIAAKRETLQARFANDASMNESSVLARSMTHALSLVDDAQRRHADARLQLCEATQAVNPLAGMDRRRRCLQESEHELMRVIEDFARNWSAHGEATIAAINGLANPERCLDLHLSPADPLSDSQRLAAQALAAEFQVQPGSEEVSDFTIDTRLRALKSGLDRASDGGLREWQGLLEDSILQLVARAPSENALQIWPFRIALHSQARDDVYAHAHALAALHYEQAFRRGELEWLFELTQELAANEKREPDDVRLHRLTLRARSLYRWSSQGAEAALPDFRERLENVRNDRHATTDERLNALSNVAISLEGSGDFEAAVDHYVEAISMMRASYGVDHPRMNAGIVYLIQAQSEIGYVGKVPRLVDEILQISLGSNQFSPTGSQEGNDMLVSAILHFRHSGQVERMEKALAHYEKNHVFIDQQVVPSFIWLNERAHCALLHQDIARAKASLANIQLYAPMLTPLDQRWLGPAAVSVLVFLNRFDQVESSAILDLESLFDIPFGDEGALLERAFVRRNRAEFALLRGENREALRLAQEARSLVQRAGIWGANRAYEIRRTHARALCANGECQQAYARLDEVYSRTTALGDAAASQRIRVKNDLANLSLNLGERERGCEELKQALLLAQELELNLPMTPLSRQKCAELAAFHPRTTKTR